MSIAEKQTEAQQDHLLQSFFNVNSLMSQAIKNFKVLSKQWEIQSEARDAFGALYLDTENRLILRGIKKEDIPDPSTMKNQSMQVLYNYYREYKQKLFDTKILTDEMFTKSQTMIKQITDKEVR
jgi:hypothetical protein